MMIFRYSLLLFVLAASAQAQKGVGNESTGRLQFYVDHAAFKMINQKDAAYVQLYFYLNRNQLAFMPKDTAFDASYSVGVLFTDPVNPANRLERNWSITLDDRVSAADTAKEVPVLFENNFLLKPGRYALSVSIRDNHDTARSGQYSDAIETGAFDGDDLKLSGIELATQALKGGNTDEMFVKNGFSIYPNPSRFYGSNLPRLTFYAEVYNLSYDAGKPSGYTVETTVTDPNGSLVKEYPSKTLGKAGSSGIIIHSVNVISLASGRYLMNIKVTDQATQKTVSAQKPFVVFREGESIYETQADDSFFRDLDEPGAIRAGNIVSLIGRSDEQKIFAALDLDGKKKFLDRFWKDRDPSPGTKSNEALLDYYRRYEEANGKFGSPNIKGWKTDMGRVWILFGPPAQVEKHEFESDKKPYQIWFYFQLKDQPAETRFVFADMEETGTQRLIHSNAKGELNNPGWLRDVQRQGQ